MEGRTRNQDVDAGIGKIQIADVAIIRDDINIEPGISLFQQRVDDAGKEIRLLMGGDQDTKGIVLFRGAGGGIGRSDSDHFSDAVEEQQEKWLNKPGGQ